MPDSASEWDCVVPFGPIRVIFNGKCCPVHPLKVNDRNVELVKHFYLCDFGIGSAMFLLLLGSKCNSHCHYTGKEKNLNMCVCVCVCVCAHMHTRTHTHTIDNRLQSENQKISIEVSNSLTTKGPQTSRRHKKPQQQRTMIFYGK